MAPSYSESVAGEGAARVGPSRSSRSSRSSGSSVGDVLGSGREPLPGGGSPPSRGVAPGPHRATGRLRLEPHRAPHRSHPGPHRARYRSHPRSDRTKCPALPGLRRAIWRSHRMRRPGFPLIPPGRPIPLNVPTTTVWRNLMMKLPLAHLLSVALADPRPFGAWRRSWMRRWDRRWP